jgi:predicted TIM-barrel fold metal-dependent hydrolase
MMSTQPSAVSLYPPGGFGAPKDRHGQANGTNVGLPEGTVVFSADNHISLADDIFYQRFPEALKDKAPRIWYEDGAYQVGRKGQSFLPGDFSAVLMQYDDLPGAASTNIDARIRELREDGVEKELAFPNAILALFHYPDKELRELAFRIYNEYIAELQERSNGHFYGAGLINWWDPQGTRRTIAELKSLGLKTFLLPLNPGKDDEGIPIDYSSTGMKPVWDEIEDAGLPVAHHIGETPPKSPCQFNSVVVGMMINIDGFREQFAKYIFSGILDDHPRLRIGWFEGGIAWVPWALQDAEHLVASYQHMFNRPLEHDVRYYWDNHMSASFMVDPLGLKLIDQIGVDKVMWSSDYPHNESTFGYSEKSLAAVVESVGAEAAARIVSGNITDFLGV